MTLNKGTINRASSIMSKKPESHTLWDRITQALINLANKNRISRETTVEGMNRVGQIHHSASCDEFTAGSRR